MSDASGNGMFVSVSNTVLMSLGSTLAFFLFSLSSKPMQETPAELGEFNLMRFSMQEGAVFALHFCVHDHEFNLQ